MTIIPIGKLNPKVWGFTARFKVLKKGAPKKVRFKDGTEHEIADYLVGDETGTILLSLFDESRNQFNEGKCYEVSEVRMTVFQNKMKMIMSKKSEIKGINEEIRANNKNKVSEKYFEEPKNQSFSKNTPFINKY